MTNIALDTLASVENAWLNTFDSNKPEVLKDACKIIFSILYCTLSTCSQEGFPWASPVFFVYDNDLNIYWSSAVISQHSQNIYSNCGRVAIAIYDSSVSEGTCGGVYFSGTASELHPDSFEQIFELMQQRAGKQFNRTLKDYQGDSPRRIYQFQPNQAWITGSRVPVGNQLVDTKIKLNLLDLKAFI